MEEISTDFLKANCLTVLDEVHTKRETVLVTKNGKPVARLEPIGIDSGEIFNFLAGKDGIKGDIVEALSSE